VHICPQDNLKTIADICVLLGIYLHWRRVSDLREVYMSRSQVKVKVIFQKVQGHSVR